VIGLVTVRFGNEYGVPILFGTRIAVWIDLDGDGITDDAETVVVFRTNAGDAEGEGKLDFGTGTWVTVDADGDGKLETYAYGSTIYYSGTGFDGTRIGTTSNALDLYKEDGDVYVDVDDAEARDEQNELAKYTSIAVGTPASLVPV